MRLRLIILLSAAASFVCGMARAKDDVMMAPAWAAPEQQPAAQAAERPKNMAHFFSRPKGTNAQEAIEFSADSFQYSADQKVVTGRGNVVLKQGPETITSDYMSLNKDTGDIYARGNIIYSAGDRVWKGEQLSYNFKTKVGRPGKFTAFIPPYFISAEDSERVATNKTILHNLTVTTCDGENPEFAVKMREAELYENDEDNKVLSGKGVTTEWGGMPVFWMPSYSRVLTTHDAWFEFMPGYGNRMGAFLLTAYNRRLGDEVLSTTHLDGRTKHGIGAGQDFTWKDESKSLKTNSVMTILTSTNKNGLVTVTTNIAVSTALKKNEAWEGDFKSYYLDDSNPFRSPTEQQEFQGVEDSTRYRLKLQHRQEFDTRDYFIGQMNYLSDPNMLRDYFDDEYRRGVQPENRMVMTHRGDEFTASLQLNDRLNDFYDNVNRLPEGRLDVNRQELGDSGLYYESHSSGGELQRVFPRGDTNFLSNLGISGVQSNYNAFRFDTAHAVFYPTRNFGFLTFTPSVGYEGTFYSQTYNTETQSVLNIVTGTNGTPTVTTNSVVSTMDNGAALRNLYTLGWESSFKAFRTWDDLIVLEGGDGLRHIAEPYLVYKYTPRPNLEPGELPQFDAIDALDLEHDIQIGMRNKLQTRYNNQVWDIVNSDIWTYYRIEKAVPTQTDFDFIRTHDELRILRSLPIDFDLAYDEYNQEVNQYDTQIAYLSSDQSRLGLEYRYLKGGEQFITPFMILFPQDKVSFDLQVRHDFNLQRMEELDAFIWYKTSCLSYGFGFRQTANNDTQGWAEVSLLAFPNTHLNLGR